MNAPPIKMGILQGDIILGQINDESGQEQTISISPDQVEQVISALRIAVETLKKAKKDEH